MQNIQEGIDIDRPSMCEIKQNWQSLVAKLSQPECKIVSQMSGVIEHLSRLYVNKDFEMGMYK